MTGRFLSFRCAIRQIKLLRQLIFGFSIVRYLGSEKGWKGVKLGAMLHIPIGHFHSSIILYLVTWQTLPEVFWFLNSVVYTNVSIPKLKITRLYFKYISGFSSRQGFSGWRKKGVKLLSSHVLRSQALASQMGLPRTSQDMAAQLEKSNSHLERNPILRGPLWSIGLLMVSSLEILTLKLRRQKPEKIFSNKFILIKFDEDKI